MEIKRVEDNLLLCKQRKAFLDELAISAGKKNKQAVQQQKQVKQVATKAKGKKEVGGFFITTVNTGKGKDLR